MRIAIYSRKSKYTGKGESIENQIEMCREYSLTKINNTADMDFFIYEDEGFSAKSLDRPQFRKMMADCKEKAFDYIVCYRLDRISRSVSDFSQLIEKLNKMGVSFICIKEQFDTSTPMGRAMMYIASVFAQLERETLAERVRDNMFMLARSGRWLGGTPPTGFISEKIEEIIIDNKIKTSCKLLVSKDEIETVRSIFRAFLENYSLSAVSKYLIANGVLSRTGKYFTVMGIRDILSNPVYCCADSDAYDFFYNSGADICFDKKECNGKYGLLAYNKRSGCSLGSIRNDISKWIVAIGKHDGIIGGRDFVCVQNKLRDNKSVFKDALKTHNDYALLSGLLICKKCSGRMFSKKRCSQDGYDYICSSKLRGTSRLCSCKNICGKVADNQLFSKLLELIKIDCRAVPYLNQLKDSLKDEKSFTDIAEQRLSSLDNEIANLLKALAASPVSDKLTSFVDCRILEIEEKRKEIINELNGLRAEPEKTDLTDISDSLTDTTRVMSALTLAEKRELIKKLIQKIEWDGESMTVFFLP